MNDVLDLHRPPRSQHPVGIAGNPNAIGGTVTVTIDGVEARVPFGSSILDAARSVGIRLPTLCNHPDLDVAGVCRMCVVEVEGQRQLQAACAYPVTGPIAVVTHSRRVRQARRHVLDLLLTEHYGECYACVRNGTCELQDLAAEYGVDSFRFGHRTQSRHPVDASSFSIVRDMDKCIQCRRCVRTCIDLQQVGVFEVVDRSDRVEIQTFGNLPMSDVVCINCGQCVNRCPTGALSAKDDTDDVWAALDDPDRIVVIQTAPAPRAAIGEMFGQPPGTAMTAQLNTALRQLGFDYVFDTNFSADLTIMEEGTELIQRLYAALVQGRDDVALPQFTSCCPGWVKYLEHFYPEFLPNASSAKSPQQMFGALIKTYFAQKLGLDPARITCCALMPCSAKKFECKRPEMVASGYADVDFGITTREVAKMLSESGIELPKLPPSGFDDPFGTATGSGVIFGASGGVMESALRTVLELVTGQPIERLYDRGQITPVRGFEGVRVAEFRIGDVGEVPELLSHLIPDWEWLRGVTLKVAVADGTANAKLIMDDIKAGGPFSDCHFIEVMACPGGCLGGGGQPIPTSREIRAARARAIYSEDLSAAVRKSYQNPAVIRLYDEFLLDGPGGSRSHRLLHTSYTPRGSHVGSGTPSS